MIKEFWASDHVLSAPSSMTIYSLYIYDRRVSLYSAPDYWQWYSNLGIVPACIIMIGTEPVAQNLP